MAQSKSTSITLQHVLPKRTQRATIVGKTGCGKTTLARYICNQFRYVVVLDTKCTIDWGGYKRYTKLEKLKNANKLEDRLIFRPDPQDAKDEDLIDEFFWWIYERGNTCLYIDEVYSVVRGNSIPSGYHACLTRGRERGITLINSVQRPKRIPQEILSEVENLYVFKLRLKQDREKLAEIDDNLDLDKISAIPNYYFYYVDYDAVNGPFTLQIKK